MARVPTIGIMLPNTLSHLLLLSYKLLPPPLYLVNSYSFFRSESHPSIKVWDEDFSYISPLLIIFTHLSNCIVIDYGSITPVEYDFDAMSNWHCTCPRSLDKWLSREINSLLELIDFLLGGQLLRSHSVQNCLWFWSGYSIFGCTSNFSTVTGIQKALNVCRINQEWVNP